MATRVNTTSTAPMVSQEAIGAVVAAKAGGADRAASCPTDLLRLLKWTAQDCF
ncbi:MAG: hypothetical protein K6C30_01435 [Bacteroidaceae bacterium]|nr:hypothetical protein [Bacteroidaceae bacterium]